MPRCYETVHAPYQPDVSGELDTQNFEHFDEDEGMKGGAGAGDTDGGRGGGRGEGGGGGEAGVAGGTGGGGAVTGAGGRGGGGGSAVGEKKKDLDFIGYTYKNFEVVGEEVHKKKSKAKPSMASIFPGAMDGFGAGGGGAGAGAVAGFSQPIAIGGGGGGGGGMHTGVHYEQTVRGGGGGLTAPPLSSTANAGKPSAGLSWRNGLGGGGGTGAGAGAGTVLAGLAGLSVGESPGGGGSHGGDHSGSMVDHHSSPLAAAAAREASGGQRQVGGAPSGLGRTLR
jgi:hypothetical protein